MRSMLPLVKGVSIDGKRLILLKAIEQRSMQTGRCSIQNSFSPTTRNVVVCTLSRLTRCAQHVTPAETVPATGTCLLSVSVYFGSLLHCGWSDLSRSRLRQSTSSTDTTRS